MSLPREAGRGPLLRAVLTAVTVSAAATSFPREAHAAPPSEEVARAVARFNRGQELYVERNFAGALVEFRKAYETAPNFRVLYNIGQVCYQMQDYVCAYRSLEQYLADGGSQVPNARRKAVGSELVLLKQRVGYLDVKANVAGAELSVDDVLVGALPVSGPVAVSAGRHKVVVEAPGRAPMTRSVDVAGQDTVEVELSFPDLPRTEPAPAVVTAPSASPPAPPAPPAPPPPPPSRMTTLSWVGYGVGGVVLAAGGVTGAVALGAAHDVTSKVYADGAAAEAARSRTGGLALASDVILATGVVVVAVTTVFTFLVPRRGSARAGATTGAMSGGFRF
jgi:hypothetical protein